MGNRQSGPYSRDAYSYNAGNELLTSTGRIIFDRDNQYEYDLNGNLIKKTQTIKGKWNIVTTYAYDDENRLTEVKIQRGHKVKEISFTYDPLGRRISKTVNKEEFVDKDDDEDSDKNDDDKGKDEEKDKFNKHHYPKTIYYVYDEQNIIAEYNENNKLIASYVHGPNIDEPLSAEIHNDWIYYHADGLGSITALTSHMGHAVQRYEYDSFGNMKSHPHWITQPYTYTAREFDIETGLYYYRARYYDAKAGRFLQRDPIGFGGGDYNLFLYVGNNPVNLIDSTGKSYLEFYSSGYSICLYSRDNCEIGCWTAYNNVCGNKPSKWQIGQTYSFSWPSYKEPVYKVGSHGNWIFNVPGCDGCGVHAGRSGPWDCTEGCIRTTDDATGTFEETHRTDRMQYIRIK
ncbi:MAG: hypothetical protein A2W27_02845 [Deltaproteobacteria bacterium RBG_16_44_11]|nr:MAG: hypothetical protein A2W27_02845 [Deltaproteobacteria bacterium RBG_16_44_11]